MRDDPTDLRAIEQEKREADARLRKIREVEVADIKWLMSSRVGRRILCRLVERAGHFRSTFDRNAMQMAFNEGNRNLGNQFLDEVMEHCPELYPVMLKEWKDDRDGNGKQSK
jgi:hypothetical protein